MTIQQILFIVIALVVLGSGVLVVTARNLFHAALFLIVSFFGVAGFYVLLDAGFFAAVQVLVYIGAIAILFIFAVMLTRDVITAQAANSQWQASVVVAAIVFVVMLLLLGPITVVIRGRNFGGFQWPLALDPQAPSGALRTVPPTYISDFGRSLVNFNEYALPFLLGGVMLMTAMVGSIWVAREISVRNRRAELEAEELATTTPVAPAPAEPVAHEPSHEAPASAEPQH